MGRVPVIGVIGANRADDNVLEIARSVGEAVADRGFHLVCGGKGGVMLAACRGFRFARNELNAVRTLAIGVLPDDSPSLANDYVDLAIPTGIGIARNAVITRMADGVISVGGGSGTLSELAYAWQMGKPIAAMVASGGWSAKLAGQCIDDSRADTVFEADSAYGAVEYIVKHMDSSPNMDSSQ